MMGERGPNGSRHVPERRSGCYYGRMDDCCTLCALRLVLGGLADLLRTGSDRAVGDHEFVGTPVLVPTLRGADDRADHVPGEITGILDVERARDAFTVRSDDGETFAITIERIDRGR